MYCLAQLDPYSAPWTQFLAFGPGFVALVLILIFLLRAMPTWKEVKIREIELREAEVKVRGAEAEGLTTLADVLRSIAVEQRRATETIDILQRVNADASERLTQNVSGLTRDLITLSARLSALETSGAGRAAGNVTG
jgi:hypothetical protein